VEDDDSSAKYDISSGMLTVCLTKVNQGEYFEDLDLTNRLLARTGEIVTDNNKSNDNTNNLTGPPKIQVLSSVEDRDDNNHPFDEALEYDFQIPQTIPSTDVETTSNSTANGYGFNNQYSGHFLHLQNPDILTVENPEAKSAVERWEEMRGQEDTKFDKDWYLADKYDPPEELKEILEDDVSRERLFEEFTMEEQSQLRLIGNRECTSPPCIPPSLSPRVYVAFR
jgi:protein SHQ1